MECPRQIAADAAVVSLWLRSVPRMPRGYLPSLMFLADAIWSVPLSENPVNRLTGTRAT